MSWSVEQRRQSCHRCDGELYLSVRVPHPHYMKAPGQPGRIRVATLCPRCDVGNTQAHPLLAFFAVHSRVDDENAQEFADLVQAWVESLPPPREVDIEALEAEIAAWRNGEL